MYRTFYALPLSQTPNLISIFRSFAPLFLMFGLMVAIGARANNVRVAFGCVDERDAYFAVTSMSRVNERVCFVATAVPAAVLCAC